MTPPSPEAHTDNSRPQRLSNGNDTTPLGSTGHIRTGTL